MAEYVEKKKLVRILRDIADEVEVRRWKFSCATAAYAFRKLADKVDEMESISLPNKTHGENDYE